MITKAMRALLRRRAALLVLAAVAAVVAVTVALSARGGQAFPHEVHARMFPLCEGCHAGIPTGDAAAFFPSPQVCANCHDGVVEPRVEWTGPTRHVDNLEFTHPGHRAALAAAGDPQLDCAQCHTPAGAARMTVVRADVQVCLSCHAHQATDHFTDARCEQCHAPFVQSDLPPQRLATLPLPADHTRPDFLAAGHGALAGVDITRCAVCHTRERCETCHVNVEDVPAIAAMPAAPADWSLPQFAVSYPLPASHLDRDFIQEHGALASRQQCAACHTQESCTTCHTQPVAPVIETLPARVAGRAAGVTTERKMPVSHASRFFQEQHAALAASEPRSCNACHTRTFCTDCHDAPLTPSYHPRNFATQHSSQAYGRRLECATCHEVRTFCRSCHITQGMSAEGRLNPGFHDAEPIWLLRHARAARQGLESCTACHTQRDCMTCHTQIGSFQVSPHGPNFDARRAQRRNPVICFACHVTDPLRGGQQ